MRLYSDKLAQHLQQQLLPVYLISGDEPLLLQECCDLVRQKAREEGCNEREIIEASVSSFNWQDILHSASNMSLFASRKLIEVRLPSGKPGVEGSKALCEYLDIASDDDVLLIVSGKIDKQSTNSKWYKSLDKAGVAVQVWPVDAKNLPGWLQQRVRSAGMSIDGDALRLLCERMEGNLLAAVQEVEKLETIGGGILELRCTLLQKRYLTMLATACSTWPIMPSRAIPALACVCCMGFVQRARSPQWYCGPWCGRFALCMKHNWIADSGQSAQQALNSRRIWQNRMPFMQAALMRHNTNSLSLLLEQAALTDGSIKGFAAGKPWDNLARLVVALCRNN